MIKDMTNKETAEHMRNFITRNHGPFAWPTDACGYDQHIKFVKYRNEFWNTSYSGDWKQFVNEYADKLEQEAV